MADTTNPTKPTSVPDANEQNDLSTPSDRTFDTHFSINPTPPTPHTLEQFREAEGRETRKRKLILLWKSLPQILDPSKQVSPGKDTGQLTAEKAHSLKAMYDSELLIHCATPASGSRSHHIGWDEFKRYADAKETELWHIFHDELDLDGNGMLDQNELLGALRKSGIELNSLTLHDFMHSVSFDHHTPHINFADFRDFFILLPRKISPAEIYQYYELRRYLGDDGRGPARVNMEGDVSLSAEDKPPYPTSYVVYPSSGHSPNSTTSPTDEIQVDDDEYDYIDQEHEEEHSHFLEGRTALKFLLAGGIAGAVSRTCTAPFDRLKIFLITRPPELGGPSIAQPNHTGIKIITNAVTRIFAEGGVLAFWTGNGLSVAKIFPESAIKFFAYESSKRAFAKYYDNVADQRDISGLSRFLSGGIGGISSQLSIYPIETLKTQMMSNTGMHKRTLAAAIRHVWNLGGIRGYYRGLTIGLVGVFPYSAIDMSTFEALKQAYAKSTGKEPGVLALLAFGSVSGSVGATSVYPLNLVRTRLQASGSSGHPQIYTGVMDVAAKTWERDGWRGFYRGLFPTLAKVIPSVSISYVVYEHTKRRLGV